MFRNRGLVCIVSDSSYVKTLPAGCILEYNPAAGQKVKEGRTIYLTINTIEVPLHIVPDVADNSSLRQAEARILASGFKLAEIQYIPGEKDWVYGVKYKGRQLSIGEKVAHRRSADADGGRWRRLEGRLPGSGFCGRYR